MITCFVDDIGRSREERGKLENHADCIKGLVLHRNAPVVALFSWEQIRLTLESLILKHMLGEWDKVNFLLVLLQLTPKGVNSITVVLYDVVT